MSGDDHGHSSTNGQEVPNDIIPVGSWQDGLLALVCIATLVGFFYWAKGFQDIYQAHLNDSVGQTHATPAQSE